MSVPHFKFTGGALKLTGARRMVFEVDTSILKAKTVPPPVHEVVAVAEVPTVAPLEVEPSAEISQAAPETGLVPQDPPAK
jgi:hypothetical protein